MCPEDEDRRSKTLDPDQTAPLEAVWTGSTLFALICLSER